MDSPRMPWHPQEGWGKHWADHDQPRSRCRGCNRSRTQASRQRWADRHSIKSERQEPGHTGVPGLESQFPGFLSFQAILPLRPSWDVLLEKGEARSRGPPAPAVAHSTSPHISLQVRVLDPDVLHLVEHQPVLAARPSTQDMHGLLWAS